MNQGNLSTTDNLQTQRFYHGTRAELKPGDLINPRNPPDVSERDRMTPYVYLTPNLDAAIWEAELAVGEGPSRVYIVEPVGQIEDASDQTDQKPSGHPSMSYLTPAVAGHRRGHGVASLPWHSGRPKARGPD